MPGFYGVAAREGAPFDPSSAMDILNRQVHASPWATKRTLTFSQGKSRIHLGIVSLQERLAALDPPKTFPAVYHEGYIYHIAGESVVPKDPTELRHALANLYLRHGYRFLDKLHGSFSMVIIHEHGVSLVTDKTCSRPFYVLAAEGFLAWSPESLPLLTAFKKILSLNLRNIGHILCSEFSFIDDTLFKEIFCLRPGEILTYQEDRIRREYYFRFRYREGPFESQDLSPEALASTLNHVAMDAISRQWAMAPSPAILLSGGLDSRYILSAVARCVSDTSQLLLVTWGVPEYRRHSDLEISRMIAERLGAKHVVLSRDEDSILPALEETFRLIGCEVDSFFHAHERLLIILMREQHGIRSLFRGEETFGWGEYRRNLKYALNQIIVSYPEDNPWLKMIFRPHVYEEMLEQWHERLEDILKEYRRGSVNDLKDVLYFNWRLARYLSTLSYFKLAYIEQFNPLLDPRILDLNSRVPSRLRVDKKLFRIAFRTSQGALKGIPYATRNNLENWEEVMMRNREIFSYLKKNLEIEDELFQDAGKLLNFFQNRSAPTSGYEKGTIFDRLKFNPRVRGHFLFRAAKHGSRIFVKPPAGTVPVKLLFRTALVKDFLHRYWY